MRARIERLQAPTPLVLEELRPLVSSFLTATNQDDLSVDDQLAYLAKAMDCPLATVAVAIDEDGTWRGYVCVSLVRIQFEWTLFVDHIYAAKPRVGRELFAWAEDLGRTLGATRVWGITRARSRGVARVFGARLFGGVVEKAL